MIESVALYLLDMTLQIGYVGIFITMFLVFTFFPIPSQIVLIPAGYLSSSGVLDIWWVVGSGTFGGVLGAHFNYYIAHHFGRDFIIKYGHYVLIREKMLNKIERFFNIHGAFSVSLAFITPGIGQLASLPAGMAGMNRKIFFLSALFGAFVWNCMMVFSGYFFGEYQGWMQVIPIAMRVGDKRDKSFKLGVDMKTSRIYTQKS